MKIGIRREDKSMWERRMPLVPGHIARLTETHQIEFHIQPSPQRIYTDAECAAAGAIMTEDLSACPVVLGVKEIPAQVFEKGKTYVFFSHTIKGQVYNMGMLRRMMEFECNLIDYETITDEMGRRLVFFGVHAGLAGMIDSLWAFGQRLKREGRDTPLAAARPAHAYDSLAAAQDHLGRIAAEVRRTNALAGCGPVVCGFAGYGHVSQGAQEIFDIFEPELVTPEALAQIDVRQGDGRFFKVVFKEKHMVEPVEASARFELQHYYDHPEKYRGVFDRYLPHLTMLINCIYWTPRYPRLVTREAVKRLYANGEKPRLVVIGDISCDPEGSIECTVHPTDPGSPVYVFDVDQNQTREGFSGRGPVILAVDILPAELPREASETFSNALVDLIPGLAAADPSGDFASWALPGPLKRAAILHKGRLTEKYAYMQQYLA